MKRVLSLFLSCIFVLGVCFSTPIVASAADDDLILTFDGATTAYEPYMFKELTAPGLGEDEKGTCALVGYTGNVEVNIESSDIIADKGTYILTKIASTAFSNGMSNTTLTIPANITSIEDGAFVGCTALTAFEVSDKSQYFTVDNGVLFNKNKTTLIAYPAAKEGTEYTIPATVTEIAEGAFADCANLKYIFTEKTSFEENEKITIGENNDIFSQSGVYHEGLTTHNFSGEEGSKKCTVCCLLEDGSDKQHTWENGKCEVCGLICKHTGVTCGVEGCCTTCEATYTASHEWTFTKPEDQNVITATCENANCGLAEESYTITIEAPTGELVYDGTEKKANIVVKEGEVTLENAPFEINNITYTLEETPVDKCINAGAYSASITLGEGENAKSVSVEYTIEKSNPKAENFIFTAPENLTYDGEEKTATVVVEGGVTGMGDVTVIYFDETGKKLNDAPVNAGVYNVKIALAEGTNYESILEENPLEQEDWEFEISKADASLTAPKAKENLVYTGEAQALVKAGSTSDGEFQYKLAEDDEWSNVIPTGTNAGDYTVYYKVVGDNNHNSVENENYKIDVTIAKATATITAPTAKTDLVYNGAEQALVVTGTIGESQGEIQYRLGEDGEWSTTVPAATDAGSYVVYYRVVGNKNYSDVEEQSFNVTIAPKTIDVSLIKESYKYDGSHHILTFKFTNADDENDVTLNGGYEVKTYKNDTLVNLLIDVGEYKVVVTLEENSNYTFINAEGQQVREKELTYTITKGVASITTAPTVNGNLVYSGVAQELVTAGSVNGGTIYYTMTPDVDNSWSTEIPKETNAGTYDVYYKVVGDTNYSDSEVESVTVTVAKKTLTDGAVSVENGEYTGSEIKPEVVVKDGETKQLIAGTDYEVYYSNNINVGDEAKVTVTFKGNYTGTVEKTFTINKAIPKAENFIFTEPKNLNYDGGAKTATVVVKDGVTGMGDVTVKYYDSEGNEVTPKAEGTYTVKINIEEGTNFNAATEITRDNWKFTINEHEHDWKYSASGATITATCQNGGCDINETIKLEVNAPENLVYDGGKKEVTYTITKGYEEVFGNKIIVNYAGDKVEQGECINKGDYTAVVKSQAGTAILEFSITPRTIIITDIEGLERVYDGTTKVDLSTATEVKYSDDKPLEFDFSKVTADAEEANVGTILVTQYDGKVTVKGDENGNYQCVVLDDKRITVEITPATLIITPDAKSSEQYYDLPALTYKVNGLIGEDELTKTPTLTTNADIKTVGNYTITATGAEASTNYTIVYAPATLTVTEHKNHKVATDGWKVTVPGTCMVVGKEAGTCTLCSGTVTRDSKIDPNNHALITTVTKKETCTQNGEALVTCANGCSYSLKTTLPADGELHNFAEDFTVIESTCVAKGSKYKVCQNPGCKVVSEKTEIAINPDAHKNIVTINAKEATCEEKGYTGDEFCNDCKKIIDPGIEINAKGHTESEWIVDKEPTFTEEGAKHTACTVCKKELKKEVIAKRALEVPEVKIENASNGIKVSWSQDEDATGYTVYSSTYNATTKKWSAWKNRGTAAATKSSWTDKTVSEGVTYRYTVRSVNGTNKSNYKATSGLCYVVAPKVTVSITSTGLLAKWNKVNNATSYIVYRRALVNGVWSSWVNLGSTKAEKNTWSDTSVQSGVTYRYTVRAVVGKVKSGYTSSSSIICLAQPLLKISNANTGITGKWDPIAGATGYTIYRSEYNPSTKKWSKWLTLGTTGATAKTFTDKTVKSGYEYKYTIRAVSGKFKSTYQDSNKLVYLAQPTLKISNVANGIQGKWSQVNGATGYIIYRRELKDGKWSNWTSLGTTKSTAKTFTDKTVKSGVTYKYTIRAKNGSYKSSYVSTGSLVFLSVPTVKISNGITGVNVSWSKIEGATSYLVYRRELVDGKWTKWAEFKTVTETSLVDETVKSGTNYRYTVRALNGKSRSMYTSTGTLYYLTAPTVTVEKVDGVVKVNWTQTVGAKGYTIYRAELGADGKWSKWVTLGTATEKYSSCKDKTAKTGVTYKYTVRAVNGKVKSAYVDGAQITNQ